MAFVFEFTSTLQDVIDRAEGRAILRTGMRQQERAIVITLGVVSGFSYLTQRFADNPVHSIWKLIVALLLIGAVVWYVIVAPRRVSRRIARSSPPLPNVKLIFDDDGIEGIVEDEGELRRTWREVTGFKVARDGLVFVFEGEPLYWLPGEVGVTHSTSTIISTSTAMSPGSDGAPTAERACLPASPNTSTIKSE